MPVAHKPSNLAFEAPWFWKHIYICFALFFALISFSFSDTSIYFLPPVCRRAAGLSPCCWEGGGGSGKECGGWRWFLRPAQPPSTTTTPLYAPHIHNTHYNQYTFPRPAVRVSCSAAAIRPFYIYPTIASCGAGHHCKSNILPLLVESITTRSFKQRIYHYNEAYIYLANNP